jgi:hydroxymethylpyrimidine/phosphomethylpyrimidine kinase
MTTPLTVLAIAGSDASGGAGVQADLRTFAAHGVHGVHGATALTALTAQNTVGVQGVHAVPALFVEQQVRSVIDDLDVAAVKTGMLATVEIVATVADLAAAGLLPNLVVDPVMVSSTGARLLDDGAEVAYRNALIPQALVVTPNRSEAAVLVGRELRTIDDVADAARSLAASGPEVVVITGGDPTGWEREAVDVVATGGDVVLHRSPRIDTVNDHGTGCSFASAVAVGLAQGHDPVSAVDRARAFVRRSLAGAAHWRLGAGHGPIDHLGWSRTHPHTPQEQP